MKMGVLVSPRGEPGDLISEGMKRPRPYCWVERVAPCLSVQVCRQTKRWRKRPRVRSHVPEKVLRSVLAAILSIACLARPARATSGSSQDCKFETKLDQPGAGSHDVSMNVTNSLDGVPPADALCPTDVGVSYGRGLLEIRVGYGGVLFELAMDGGDFRALFMDVAANYEYLTTLNDHGPTLVRASQDIVLGNVTLGEDAVDSVGNVEAMEGHGAFDMGISFDTEACPPIGVPDGVRQVSLRLVGCDFTVAQVAHQRIAVATKCVGDDMQSESFTYGFGSAVPGGCNPYEVVDASAAAGKISSPSDSNVDSTTIDNMETSYSTGDRSIGGGRRSSDEEQGNGTDDVSSSTSGASDSGTIADRSNSTSTITSSSASSSNTGVSSRVTSSNGNSSGHRNSISMDDGIDHEGDADEGGESGNATCQQVSALLTLQEAPGRSVSVHVLDPASLSSNLRSVGCTLHTVTLVISGWDASGINAAFFDLQDEMLNLDELDIVACVKNPLDGSVKIESEKLEQDSLSSIEGFNSGSTGFDFAIALDGDTPYVEIELSACGLSADIFAGERATVVISHGDSDMDYYTFDTPSLECSLDNSETPSPTSVVFQSSAPVVSPTGSSLTSHPVSQGLETISPTEQLNPSQTVSPTVPFVSRAPMHIPTHAPMTAPSPAPTVPLTEAPTAASMVQGSTIRGIVKVSGLDPDSSEEDVYEDCRDGIAQAFGVESRSAVTVASPGLLPTRDGSYYGDVNGLASSPTSTATSIHRHRGIGRKLLSSAVSSAFRLLPEHLGDSLDNDEVFVTGRGKFLGGGNAQHRIALATHIGQGQDHKMVYSDRGTEQMDSVDPVGSTNLHSFARELGSAPDEVQHRIHRRYLKPRAYSGGQQNLQSARENSSRPVGDRRLSTSDKSDDGVLVTTTMSVAFEVLFEDPESSTLLASEWKSPSSRVAAMVEAYAEGGGRAALADTLGVSPSNISLSELLFCSDSDGCNYNETTTASTQSVVAELGTSSPWETFLKYGGLLILALFGTCCVSLCFWAICYRILFHEASVRSPAGFKAGVTRPLPPTSVVCRDQRQYRSGSGKVDVSGSSGSRRGPSLPPRSDGVERPRIPMFSATDMELGAISSNVGDLGDGREGDMSLEPGEVSSSRGSGSGRRSGSMRSSGKLRVLGHRRSSGSLRGSTSGRGSGSGSSSASGSGSASGSASGGSGDGEGHWTSSQFVRLHSLDEYHAQNPLRSSDTASMASRHSSNRSNRSNRRFNLTSSKSYKDDFALESVGYSGDYEEQEGEFKTTNPMFIGRDNGSPSPEGSPAPVESSTSSFVATAAGADRREGVGVTEGIRGTPGGRFPGRGTTHVESPIAMLSERTSSDTTGDDSPEKIADSTSHALALAKSSNGSTPTNGEISGESGESGQAIVGTDRGRNRIVGSTAGVVDSVVTGEPSSPDGEGGATSVAATGAWGPDVLYGELQDVSPSLSPGATSETSSSEKVVTGISAGNHEGELEMDEEEKPPLEKSDLSEVAELKKGDSPAASSLSAALAAPPAEPPFPIAQGKLADYPEIVGRGPEGDHPPEIVGAESGSTAGDRSPTRGSVAATTEEGTESGITSPGRMTEFGRGEMDEPDEGMREETKRVVLSPLPPEGSPWEEARRPGMEGREVEIRTTRSGSPTSGRRRGGSGGLSMIRNTWQGLMGGRVGSRGRNRGHREQGVGTPRTGSPSPPGARPVERHPSAMARWSMHSSQSQEPENVPSTPGPESVSGSSTITGTVTADILSQQTTVSAESDLSVPDVFTQSTVSPAGLAAAAAASSPDLFQSGPEATRVSAPSVASTTPRVRPSATVPASSPRTQGVLAAVAAAAVETADEEEARKVDETIAPGKEDDDHGVQTGSRDRQKGSRHLWEERATDEARQGRRDSLVAISPETATGSENEESPPSMKGPGMPVRLATPQALLSPTTPSADTVSNGGTSNGTEAQSGESTGLSEDESSKRPEIILSPDSAEISPYTNSDRGSSPSPIDLPRTDVLGMSASAVGGGRKVEDEQMVAGFAGPLRLDYGSGAGGGDELTPGEATRPRSRRAEPTRYRGDGGGDGEDDGLTSALSPWISTRRSHTPGAKEQEAMVSAEATRVSDDELNDDAADISPHLGARPLSLPAQSLLSADLALDGSGASGATGARPASMGGSGAAEARGGLLAARAGTLRTLGTLDLMQVIGTFSDSESPSEEKETAPGSQVSTSPTGRPSVVSTVQPSSPISIVPLEVPSPLTHITTGAVVGQLSPPTPLPSITAGHSPGVESTREYSESDDDTPDTPGDLMDGVVVQ